MQKKGAAKKVTSKKTLQKTKQGQEKTKPESRKGEVKENISPVFSIPT